MENQVIQADFGRANLTVIQKVGNSRKTNDALRGRRHLTKQEVSRICEAIRKDSRYPDRDELMVLSCFHHGLRVSELVGMKWQYLSHKMRQIAIKRAKRGIDTVHPISDKRELMLLRRLHKAQGKPTSGFMFLNERGGSVSVSSFQKLINKYSEQVLGIKFNAHALRHGCATSLIEKGHDIRMIQTYMGHANIQNTVLYLHESAKQFNDIEW